MNDTLAAALITQARNLAAAYRYADAVRVLDTADFREFAATSQHPDMLVVLSEYAWWLAWSKRTGDALAILESLEDRLTTDLPAQLRFTILARHAYVTGISGGDDTSQRAATMYAEILQDLDPDAEVSTELRFHLRRQQARWLGTAGEPQQALSLLRALEREMVAQIPHDSEEWLLLMSNLAYFTATSGPQDEAGTKVAIARYNALVEGRTSALGALHPHTLDARRNHAWVLGRRDPAGALEKLAAVVHDAGGVLEADHRYVMAAHLDMAVLASRIDDVDTVAASVDRAVDAVAGAQSVRDVLSEYGDVVTPAAKLDEVAGYLAVRDPGRCDAVQSLRTRLLEA